MGIKRNKELFFVFLLGALLSCANLLFASSQQRQGRAYAYYLKARVSEKLGDIQPALKLYDQAREADPRSYRIPLNAALAYIRLGKFEAARGQLLSAQDLSPDNLDVRLILAMVYSSLKQPDLAAGQYEFILQKQAEANPDNPEIVLSLARLYYQQKKIGRAIAQYRHLLRLTDDKAEVYLLLGNLLADSGDLEAGIANIKKALELRPDYPDAQNSLGYLYVQKGGNLKQAVGLIKKALAQDRDNAAYIDSLGWAYFKQGRLKEAKGQLERAVKMLTDPVIYDHLGDVYFAQGLNEQALSAWRRSLQLNPGQKKIKEKIDELSKEGAD